MLRYVTPFSKSTIIQRTLKRLFPRRILTQLFQDEMTNREGKKRRDRRKTQAELNVRVISVFSRLMRGISLTHIHDRWY